MITSLSIGTGGLGRFGNQLYTIASVIGIADKSGQTFGFPEWKNHDNALFGGEVTNLSEVFENPLPKVLDNTYFTDYGYFWGYRDIFLPHGNWSINAHMQSPKFFDHCIDKVRRYFTMKDEPEQNDYCAIHYRAGDYIDDPTAYHPRCSYEYYREAMSMMPEGTEFIVFSDGSDEEVLSKIPPINRSVKIVKGDSYLDEFKLMKKCKHFIIANSTFSSMAATLANHSDKKVIAPKRWFGSQANGMNWNDGYEKNWIVI